MSRRRSILLALCALSALGPAVGVASARDWGFTRDTVTEWGDTATGRVHFVNAGAGPLALDSMFAEQVDKPWSQLSLSLDLADPAGKVFSPLNPVAALGYSLPAGASTRLRTFDVIPATCALKVAVDSLAGSDTLAVRLRVRATSGDEDTLIVLGTSCSRLSVGVRPPRAPGRPGASPSRATSFPRDFLGRDLPAPRFAPRP